nr:MAG TPA: hypothetical protein [Caudoviricetes sp.]
MVVSINSRYTHMSLVITRISSRQPKVYNPLHCSCRMT